VKEGDLVEIRFGEKVTKLRILKVAEHMRKEETAEMYEIL
jgi:ribosomal 50S subunit-recycling heat shock protein